MIGPVDDFTNFSPMTDDLDASRGHPESADGISTDEGRKRHFLHSATDAGCTVVTASDERTWLPPSPIINYASMTDEQPVT